MMDFFTVIEKRVSVRNFSEKEVEDEKIKKILTAAQKAPSWQNRQPWHFIVVKDKELINKIGSFRPLTLNINIFLKKAPVIIILVSKKELSGSRAGLDYFLVDCAIAMEHLILKIPKDFRIIALTPLGYPQEESLLGKVVKTFAQSRKRKPLSQFVFLNQWGNKWEL
jgi:nitroreductase